MADNNSSYWEEEAREGVFKIACAMGTNVEDVAAAVESVPGGMPPEAPVSRLGNLADKSNLVFTAEDNSNESVDDK